jgi:hypothetical protein
MALRAASLRPAAVTVDPLPTGASVRPPATGDPPDPADSPDTSQSSPLEPLHARLGPASEEEIAQAVGPTPEADLIEWGREVDTSRITDDAQRLGTQAADFFAKAPKSVRQCVRLTEDFVRIVVGCAYAGDQAWRALRRDKAQARTAKSTSSIQSKKCHTEARMSRDQLAAALRGVAAGDAVTLEQVRAAVQPAAEGQVETGPGRALDDLVTVARAQIKSEDPGVRARCGLHRVDHAWLKECATQASASLAAERAEAVSTANDSARQARVDLWDGRSLTLVDSLVAAFAAGHKACREVPQLRVKSLRGEIGSHSKRKKIRAPANPPAGGDPSGGAKPA